MLGEKAARIIGIAKTSGRADESVCVCVCWGALESFSEHRIEDYLVSIRGKTLLQQDKWQFNNFECLESVSISQNSITVIKATNISSLGTCPGSDKIYCIMRDYDLFMAYCTLWLLSLLALNKVDTIQHSALWEGLFKRSNGWGKKNTQGEDVSNDSRIPQAVKK